MRKFRRKNRTAQAAITISDKTVVMIGDSLTGHMEVAANDAEGSAVVEQAYRTEGWGEPHVMGISGKHIMVADYNGKTTAQNIQDYRNNLGREPDIWIIALISNDLFRIEENMRTINNFIYDLDTVLAELGPMAKIGWVNIGLQYRSQLISDMNAILQTKINARGRARIIDWYTFAAPLVDAPENWMPQGHLTAENCAMRDQFIAREATRIYTELSP